MTTYPQMPAPGSRVAVAMSGGVDSSVAAYLLQRQGYEVVGLSMHLYNLDLPDTHKFDTCCSLDDLDQARRVAEDLGFAHFVVDYTVPFADHVVKPFVAAYAAGETPNPCVWCNDRVKFRPLFAHAARLGCDYLATGHYARIDRSGSVPRLRRAVDARKDQSYFLFSLSSAQLSRTLFPLGELTKEEVRAIAAAAGLATAHKSESQDICFIPDGDVVAFLETQLEPEARVAGAIIDSDGVCLGEHAGIHRFTVGQRRGLGIAAERPLYVQEIRAQSGDVVVVPRERLLRPGLIARDVRWVHAAPTTPVTAAVQVRSRSRAVAATIDPRGDRAEVRFHGPGEVVSPGQAAVFYAGDEVLGGGWIAAALDA